MPITYTIHKDPALVVTHFTGRVADGEFVDLYRGLYADEAYELGTNELADLRQCELLDVSIRALRTVEELAEARYAGADARFRTAIIAPHDQSYGLARMYEVFAEEGPEYPRVYRTVEDALAWLDLSPEDIEL